MKNNFILKLSLFLLPVMLCLLIAVGATMYVGEVVSLRDVALLQMGNDPVLFGRYYTDNLYSYKLIATDLRQPEILVLGSSRVWQFRAMFFNLKTAAFYNATGSAGNIYQMYAFLQTLEKSALPKILIVGLDQEWFNPNWAEIKTSIQYDDENHIAPTRVLQIIGLSFQNILIRKVGFGLNKLISRTEPIYHSRSIGLNALEYGGGFRNDGSYQYGNFLLNPPSVDDRLAYTKLLLTTRDRRFELSDQVDSNALEELDRLLRFCQINNIAIVGFSPPYAPSIYHAMMEQGGYDYIAQSTVKIDQLFQRYGFKYLDFTDITKFGVTDEDMFDGIHSSEYVTLQMYLHMFQQSIDLFGKYSDLRFLENALLRPNRFALFDDPPNVSR